VCSLGLNGELESPGRPFIFADPASDDERRFLSQFVEFPEEGMVLIRAEDRRLENARAVADKDKADLAARALVIDPAADLDLLVLVSRDVFNINPFHGLKIIRENWGKVNEEKLSDLSSGWDTVPLFII